MAGLFHGSGNGFLKSEAEVIFLKKILVLIGLFVTQASVFFFEEAWTIAMVGKFHIAIAILLTTCLFSFFSITTTWLCENTGLDKRIDEYIDKKKKDMAETAKKAMAIGFWFICLKTAIVVSPSVTAIIMYILGRKRPCVYYLNVFFSFITAIIWCLIYSGGIAIIKKIFLK